MLTETQPLLGQPERYRRSAGQPFQQLLDGAVEFGQGYCLVNHSPVGGIRRADFLAEQQHSPGPGQADQPGQQPGRTRIRAEATVHERLPEHRVSRGYCEISGQRQVAAKPRSPSPHAADHRQLNASDELDHAMGGMGNPPHQITSPGTLPAVVVRGHPIGAGAEVVSGAPDVDRP